MKDFIPYEEALALKELGFDEECLDGYNKYGKLWGMRFDNQSTVNDACSAPLFSQAFRFFRKKYGLFISFVRYRKSVVIEMPDTFSKVYEIWIQDENKDESIWVGSFDGQEEAELACLRKLIEIVKQKQ
jgi:hypothetical protein